MQRRPETRRPSSPFLLGAFAAVALSFVAVALYTHAMTRQIDVASDAIAHNSAPSIEHLAAIRVESTDLEHLMARYLGLFPEPVAGRGAIEGVLAAIDRDTRAYQTLPQFPGEQAYSDELQGSVQAVTGAARRIMALVDAGAYDAARAAFVADLRPAVAHSADSLMRSIEFNARNGRYAAVRIQEIRRHALWVGIGLDALCVIVAVLAGVIVRWQVRRYGDLVESYTRVVEERSGELEFFAGRVAHDIVNPVGAAQLAIQVAVRHGAPDAQTRDILDRANRSLMRAQAMIDGLLRFARAGARPDPGAVADVRSVVEDVVTSMADSGDASGITLRWDAVECRAACDPGVLTSILSNLVHNATKYIGDRPERRVEVRARLRKPGVVHFEVEDSGNGLPGDLVGRAFEPYVRGAQNDKPGLGLGLATVKRLVEGHGGAVGVDSEPGRGCTFWFEMPVASARRELGAAVEGA